MKKIIKNVILMRFIRGFIAGSVASMITFNVADINTFSSLTVFLQSLAISGILGGINGGLLALDKWSRSL